MKKLYSVLIALGVLALFASMAGAAAAKPAFPSWSQQINTTKRFTALTAFGGAAVLDAETGLVWEQSPSTTTFDWANAEIHCYRREVGGRKGWRFPTIEELASLVDPSQANPSLALGHPFSNVQSSGYWSGTTLSNTTAGAWGVLFNSGDVGLTVGGDFVGLKTLFHFVWCVRGGQGVEPH